MIDIRPVLTRRDLDRVHRLVHDVYVAAGYFDPQPDGRLPVYPTFDDLSETLVLAAVDGAAIVGTVSITIDGPAGLTCDHDFRAECDAIRSEGRVMFAVWRNATAQSHRASRLDVALLRAATALVVGMGIETFVSTVEPSLERAYVKLLGMATVARTEGVGGVRSAGLLMRGDSRRTLARLGAHSTPDLDAAVREWRGRLGWAGGADGEGGAAAVA